MNFCFDNTKIIEVYLKKKFNENFEEKIKLYQFLLYNHILMPNLLNNFVLYSPLYIYNLKKKEYNITDIYGRELLTLYILKKLIIQYGDKNNLKYLKKLFYLEKQYYLFLWKNLKNKELFNGKFYQYNNYMYIPLFFLKDTIKILINYNKHYNKEKFICEIISYKNFKILKYCFLNNFFKYFMYLLM